LRAKLAANENFDIVPFNTIDAECLKKAVSGSDYTNEDKAIDMSMSLKADIAVMTQFSVYEDKILINSTAFDIIANQPTVASTINGNAGTEIFSYVDKLSDELAKKMAMKFGKVDKGFLEEFIKNQSIVIEEENQKVINDLLLQKSKYKKLTVKRAGKERNLAIPFGKNVIILINQKEDKYQISTGTESFTSKAGIKILFFPNRKGTKRTFQITGKDGKKAKIDYTQKVDYEISIKEFSF
jgi:hypothetical protein